MNCWNFLGITPTVDVKIIKKAYANKLRIYHPEDDPEGFGRLRVAYEEALKEAKVLKVVAAPNLDSTTNQDDIKFQTPKPTLDVPVLQTPSSDKKNIPLTITNQEIVEQFMTEVSQIYNDFFLRINEKTWLELLNSEIYWRIDVRIEIQQQLLRFLMGNFRLPHKIWQILDEHFFWKEQYSTLCKEFPKKFIDFIVSKIEKNFVEFSYDFVKGDCDFDIDLFIDYREEAFYALRRNDLELASEILAAANKIYANDLDLIRLFARYYSITDQFDQALAEYNRMLTINIEDIDAHFNRAILLQRQGDFKAALNDYQWLLKKLPEDLKLLSGLANCYKNLGKLLEAKTIYEQIIDSCPYEVDAYFQITSLNYQLVDKYQQELNSNPDNSKLQFEIASLLYNLEEYEDCYEVIKVVQGKPKLDSASLLLIGQVLAKLNKIDQGLEWINKALERCKVEGCNGYEVLIERANILEQNKCYKEAIIDYLAALEINPYNHELLYSLAETHRRVDLLPQCINYATKAIALKNDIWVYYSVRGLAYYYEGHFKEARADHEIVIANSSTFAEAWFRLAFCNLNLEAYDKAIECFTKAWDYDNELTATYLYKAIALIKTNKLEKALQNINLYIDKVPNSVQGYFIKGHIYQLMGEFENAISEYCNGSDQNPKSFLLARTAFYYVNLKGLSAESIKYLIRLTNLDPGNDLVITMVAHTLMQLNNEKLVFTFLDNFSQEIKDYSNEYQTTVLNSVLNRARVLANRSSYQQLMDYIKEKFNYVTVIDRIPPDESALRLIEKAIENYQDSLLDFSRLSISLNDLKGFLNWTELLIEMGDSELVLPKYYLLLDSIKNKTINIESENNILYRICQYAFSYERLLKHNNSLELIDRLIDCISVSETSFAVKFLANAWIKKGSIFESLERFQEALECMEEAIRIDPKGANYWHNKGKVFLKLERNEEAKVCFEKVKEIDPDYVFDSNE